MTLERLAIGVAQQAGTIGNLGGDISLGADGLVVGNQCEPPAKAAWSAGSFRRKKSGVPSPKRSVQACPAPRRSVGIDFVEKGTPIACLRCPDRTWWTSTNIRNRMRATASATARGESVAAGAALQGESSDGATEKRTHLIAKARLAQDVGEERACLLMEEQRCARPQMGRPSSSRRRAFKPIQPTPVKSA